MVRPNGDDKDWRGPMTPTKHWRVGPPGGDVRYTWLDVFIDYLRAPPWNLALARSQPLAWTPFEYEDRGYTDAGLEAGFDAGASELQVRFRPPDAVNVYSGGRYDLRAPFGQLHATNIGVTLEAPRPFDFRDAWRGFEAAMTRAGIAWERDPAGRLVEFNEAADGRSWDEVLVGHASGDILWARCKAVAEGHVKTFAEQRGASFLCDGPRWIESDGEDCSGRVPADVAAAVRATLVARRR